MDLALPKTSQIVRHVVPVKMENIETLTQVMVSAYQHDPLLKKFEENDSRRFVLLQILFSSILRYSVKYGRADMSVDGKAVACWLPPSQSQINFAKMIKVGMWKVGLKVPLRSLKKLLAYDAVSQKLRASLSGSSTWYMWAMAVAPGHQGQGLSKHLYRAVTDRTDRAGESVYVETANPRVMSSLMSLGFVEKGQILLNNGVQLHGLIRAGR